MADKKIALVLSGGGAKGAFQYGALEYLIRYLGYDFNIIAGVSVGALNAALIAQDDLKELSNFWHTIREKDIMRGSMKWWDILWRFYKKRLSIYNNKPLRDLIQKNIDPDKILEIGKTLLIGVVCLETGKYTAVQARSTYFKDFILASTAIPMVFPPTKIRHDNRTHHYVDGGVRNICPLADVFKYEPDEIVIINCSDPDYLGEKTKFKSALDIGTRTIDILANEVFRNDLEQDHPGSSYACEVHLIEPTKPLGETLDFDRKVLNMRIQHGFERAKEVFAA